MPCTNPRRLHSWPQAFVLGLNPEKFGKYFSTSCGQCRWCRWMLTKEWAVRCCLEAETSSGSAFVTLTYAPEHLPENGSLVKKDLQDFLKRLRINAEREYGVTGIRYYAAGEYSTTCPVHGDASEAVKASCPDCGGLFRPHYHVLLFGFDFPDMKFFRWQYRPNIGRYKVYRSAFLEKCWKLGFSTVGEVSTSSAAYVCGYIRKKVNGDAQAAHYGDRIPEFSLSSTSPGIGAEWYERNKHWLWQEMSVRVGKWSIDPPRYFFKLLAKEDPDAAEAAKLRLSLLRDERRASHVSLDEGDASESESETAD